MTPAAISNPAETIVLSPSFRLPIGLGTIAIALYWVNLWAALIVGVFAIFLSIQAVILSFHFTSTAFELYRGKKQLRCFPYAQWINWQIFVEPVPILFYFKETQSIHFLPIVFNAKQLKSALTQHCPKTDLPAAQQ